MVLISQGRCNPQWFDRPLLIRGILGEDGIMDNAILTNWWPETNEMDNIRKLDCCSLHSFLLIVAPLSFIPSVSLVNKSYTPW